MANKTPFITFEGGEGAGKSTQIKLLKSWLETRGKSVITTREPGGTPGAETIRDLIVKGHDSRWSAKTETLLFMAARCDHIEKIIMPALQDGTWVLCDRFVDSTYAYQAFGRGLDLADLRGLYQFIASDLQPDLTFILDIDPKLGLLRAAHGKGRAVKENRFENLDFSFHEKLRDGYKTMALQQPERFEIITIAENETPDAIHARLCEQIQKRLVL